MKARSIVVLGGVAAACLQGIPTANAQGAPDIVWEAVTPNTLANSIQGVGWSPAPLGHTAFGSTDRWVRSRAAQDGALLYSVLQPIRSGDANQILFSTDGAFLAVHNSGGGLSYRVHRGADGFFLGELTTTIDGNGVVHFAPSAALLTAVGGDGTLSRWRFDQFTVVLTVGSGYQRTNTTFNFSPDGLLQSAASQGTIIIRERSSASVIRVLSGGLTNGVSPAAFTPDSARLAVANRNVVTLWRITDGTPLMRFAASSDENVGAVRFTPDGAHLVTTGYLPYVDNAGLWQQRGVIRFWRVSDGTVRRMYDARTGIAVTSPVAWSPDGSQFAFGTYEGTAVVARTPLEVYVAPAAEGQISSVEILSNGNVLLRRNGVPGADYHVEATADFRNWRELGTTTANSSGSYQFLDTNAYRFSVKFYRSWRAP